MVCDFRSRDVAAGGQGAPLVPAFHAETFGRAGQGIAVLNVGGIANLSWLPPTGSVSGFDCGPGNVLMDFWCQRHQGQSFDAGGRWAASGRVDPGLLQSLMREPYFSQLAPKSTGRDLFNAAWLGPHLAGAVRRAEDVMATLLELSVAAACEALRHCGSAPAELLVCGGGAFNDELMRRLSARLEPGTGVYSTARYGVAPDRVEALAFAWLARSFCERRPANLPAVTGAAGPRILGALYPAR